MITTSRRVNLLALAVTFSAGIHAALVPEHLEEMPRLGELFIAAAAIGRSRSSRASSAWVRSRPGRCS
jgi:transposase